MSDTRRAFLDATIAKGFIAAPTTKEKLAVAVGLICLTIFGKIVGIMDATVLACFVVALLVSLMVLAARYTRAYFEVRNIVFDDHIPTKISSFRGLCLEVLCFILNEENDSRLEERVVGWGCKNYGETFIKAAKQQSCSKQQNVIVLHLLIFMGVSTAVLLFQTPFILLVELKTRLVLMAAAFIASGLLSWILISYMAKRAENRVKVSTNGVDILTRGVISKIKPRDLQAIRYSQGIVQFLMRDSSIHQTRVTNVMPILYVCVQENPTLRLEPMMLRVYSQIIRVMASRENTP